MTGLVMQNPRRGNWACFGGVTNLTMFFLVGRQPAQTLLQLEAGLRCAGATFSVPRSRTRMASASVKKRRRLGGGGVAGSSRGAPSSQGSLEPRGPKVASGSSAGMLGFLQRSAALQHAKPGQIWWLRRRLAPLTHPDKISSDSWLAVAVWPTFTSDPTSEHLDVAYRSATGEPNHILDSSIHHPKQESIARCSRRR